jgi:hypothetical protein
MLCSVLIICHVVVLLFLSSHIQNCYMIIKQAIRFRILLRFSAANHVDTHLMHNVNAVSHPSSRFHLACDVHECINMNLQERTVPYIFCEYVGFEWQF